MSCNVIDFGKKSIDHVRLPVVVFLSMRNAENRNFPFPCHLMASLVVIPYEHLDATYPTEN